MIGTRGTNQWTALLKKCHYPIMCRVLEYSDQQKVDITQAAHAIEKQRLELGDFTKLLASDDVKKFIGTPGKELRTPFMATLMSEGYVSTLLEALVPPSARPVEKKENIADQLAVDSEEQAPALPANGLTTVPVSHGAVTRYLALDPSLSCGFAIVQLNASSEVVSIDMGALEVDKSLIADGPRALNLLEQLRPLLDPAPDCVFSEQFFAHERQQGVAINFKLRGAVEMELAGRGIECTEVAPQTWKKVAVGKGNADKDEVKTALEETIGFSFPSNIYIRGRWLKCRSDACDAVGIAMWGVAQQTGSPPVLSPGLRVSAPGFPKSRDGVRRAPLPMSTIPPEVAIAEGSSSSDPIEMDVQEKLLPDAWACTLAPGCVLRVSHKDVCQFPELCARSKEIDFCQLSGKKRMREH